MDTISLDDPSLKLLDEMNMNILHVLSCNPNATLEMITKFACKYPDTALVETRNGSFPVELYLVTRNIVKVESNLSGERLIYDKIRSLMQRGTLYTVHDLIKVGLRYDDTDDNNL